MNKYYKSLTLVIAFLILSLVTVASFAYFSASVQGNDNAYDTVITSGEMTLMLNDGEQISLNNAIPGDSVTKEFSVKNTGTVQTTYDVYFSELLNEFEDKNDLVYTLISENGCADENAKVFPSSAGEESKFISACMINPNQTHNYILTITFKDDGTNQDDNKGKSVISKLSVNEYKNPSKTIARNMLDLKDNGSTDLVYDETLDNNLRYIGANPNNYVEFNGELWRVIGLMNNIEKEDGTTEALVKIRRANLIGNYSWDSSEESINGGQGINQWGESTYSDGTSYEGSDLMRELNTDYLGNTTVGDDGNWYNGNGNQKSKSMPTSIISNDAQSMMETVVWNLGATSNESDNDPGDYNSYKTIVSSDYYTRERGTTSGKTCSGGTNCNDNVVRTVKWLGKVGLFYPSDFLYATSGGSKTSRDVCLNKTMYYWDYDSDIKDCKRYDWLYYEGSHQWTMSVYNTPSGSSLANYIYYTYGYTSTLSVCGIYAVFPVVFLKSNVNIVDGNGTSDSPYRLSM